MSRSFNELTPRNRTKMIALVESAAYLLESGVELSELVEILQDEHNSGLSGSELKFITVTDGPDKPDSQTEFKQSFVLLGEDQKYGKVYAERGPSTPFDPAQPVFVLIARDPFTPETINDYMDRVRGKLKKENRDEGRSVRGGRGLTSTQAEMVDRISDAVELFYSWQDENETRMPD